MGQQKTREYSLQTREQKYKAVKWNHMFIPRDVITSKAYFSLKTAPACQVYLIFRTKCRMEKVQGKPKRKNNWIIGNNGEIQFSYKEALEKWGIGNKKFTRALDDLIRVGLIDITHSGFGLEKDCSLYAISERWRLFGTNNFVVQVRQKRNQCLGFAKGNTHGKNCSKKQNQRSSITIDQQSLITVAPEIG